ncbi:MAG: PAS domain S-box protein [Verrucomicrobia bacterium]|nr:PAS domain S-box protein [Verrucomicrobiota bacterium]
MASPRKSKPRDARRKAPRLAALRNLLAEIVESSGDAIFSRKLDGTISTWNAAAERIFGYRAQEIVGRSSTVLLPPDRPNELRQLMERVRRGERITHFETVRLRKDRKPLTLSMHVSPIRNGRGQIVGASTIARDITAEREVETRIMEISEQGRQNLGRDLHDGLGQHLGGIELLCRSLAWSLRKARRPEARTAELLVRQIQGAMQQTRSLARGLTPVMDKPNGLMVAMESLSTTVRGLYRVRACGASSAAKSRFWFMTMPRRCICSALRRNRWPTPSGTAAPGGWKGCWRKKAGRWCSKSATMAKGWPRKHGSRPEWGCGS